MKKILLFSLLLFCFSVLKVNAYTFPEKIKISNIGDTKVDGFSMTTIKGTINDFDRNLFCTRWGLVNPNQYDNDICVLTTWPNVDNEKASAAIGSIISYWRKYSNSYFYTTVAINRFLYEMNMQANALNEIAPSVKTLNMVNESVEEAKEIYNNYGNDYLIIKNVKFNGTSLSDNGTIDVYDGSNSENYIIRAIIECYDKDGGNKISCDSAGVDKLTINDNNISDFHKNINIDKNVDETIISMNVPKDSIDLSKENKIIISFYNQREYLIAQNYFCGYEKQTISPNYILVVPSPKKSEPFEFKIKGKKNTKNCEDSIGDPKINLELYKEHGYEGLLDTQNPSCDNIDLKINKSCEKTVSTNQFVKELEIDGQKELALCKTNFVFENLVYNNSYVSKNSLLYMSNYGKFGKSTVTYDCDIPEKYGVTDGVENITVGSVNEIAPSLKLVFGPDYGIGDVNFDSDVSFVEDSRCYISDDKKIVCSSYSDDNLPGKHVIKFTATIDYTYSDNNKYALSSDGELKKWVSGDEVYGYGVLIPSTFDKKSGETLLKFSGRNTNENDTIFSIDTIDNSSVEAVCNFNINSEFKNEILYRTIDVNNPFNHIDGTERQTGSNWCTIDVDSAYTEDNINEIEQYRAGDVNMDGVVDYKDVNIVNMFVSEFITPDETQILLADVDNDGIVSVNDATLIQGLEAGYEYPDNLVGNEGNTISIPVNYKYCRGNKDENETIKKYIYLRPNADGRINLEDGSTKSSKPLYRFELKAENIKKIREYNKKNASYKDSGVEDSTFMDGVINNNYVTLGESLCDVSTKCDVSEVIQNQFGLGG